MRGVTTELLLLDQIDRISNCFNSDNDIIDFINDINYEQDYYSKI